MLECAANLACVGAEPLGTTNNLNFGNPEKAHIAWQLTESVRGLGEACRALEAPIVGGNVSLYNEGATSGPIYPTPVIGMVGRLPDARRAGRLGFAREGDAIALVGPFAPSLAASELAKLRGEALPDGLAGDRHRGGLAAARSPSAKRSARGAGERPRHRRGRPRRSRWPSAAWPAASAPRSTLGELGAGVGPLDGAVRRGPGRVHPQRHRARRCASWGARPAGRAAIGTVGGEYAADPLAASESTLSATLVERARCAERSLPALRGAVRLTAMADGSARGRDARRTAR